MKIPVAPYLSLHNTPHGKTRICRNQKRYFCTEVILTANINKTAPIINEIVDTIPMELFFLFEVTI